VRSFERRLGVMNGETILSERMQAWLARETGPWRDVLRCGELTVPELKPGEALIRTAAASVVFADLLTIAGRYQIKPTLPFAPGFEAAGRVVETTEGCPWKIGDRLVAIDVCGGWAEYAVARPEASFAVPESMSDAQAAAFVINYHTAYFGLFHRGRLEAGETLLVHGGAGGVGTAGSDLPCSPGRAGTTFGWSCPGRSSTAGRATPSDASAAAAARMKSFIIVTRTSSSACSNSPAARGLM